MRALATVIALGLIVSGCRPTPPPTPPPATKPALPVFASLPAPAFVDQDNRPFNSERMKGRVWIANFIFTTCAMACPILTARMATLQTRLKTDTSTIQLLSFSILPETDTPPVLTEYGQKFHQDTARWTMVTGPVDPILNPVSDGFVTAAAKDKTLLPNPEANFSSQHGELFVLIDQDGKVRGYYRKDDASLERLVKDARELASPAS